MNTNKTVTTQEIIKNAKFEVFIAMTKVVVYWVVMPYRDMIAYRHFRGPVACICPLKLRQETAWTSETLVS
jgi:hypothetical protein